MEHALDFIALHGGPFVFVIVFLDQLGLPIPTVPILLAIGALAGVGKIDPTSSLLLAISGSVCADLAWFQLGRWKGSRVLEFLCRIALEPDSCVSKTHELFGKHGVKALLIAKFVPGFDTVASPLAGMLGVGVLPFAFWSGAGALLWLGTFGGLGYLFSDHLEELTSAMDRLGSTFGLIVVAMVGLYLGSKYQGRQRVLRSIRMARITPEELHELIVSGSEPVILDVRSQTALDSLPFLIQGARLVTLEDIDRHPIALPREREVVVYCS